MRNFRDTILACYGTDCQIAEFVWLAFNNKYAKAMPTTSIGIALVYLLPTLNIFFLVSILHAVLQWYFLLCSSSWCKHIFSTAFKNTHYVKSVRIRSHSGLYLTAFRLNTERYGVPLRIQTQCGKIRTRITANTDTFYVVTIHNETKSVGSVKVL